MQQSKNIPIPRAATIVPGGIPVIVRAIQTWRLLMQVDKIYLMPPAQRAIHLAELDVLAQQLKAAQIAQMQ